MLPRILLALAALVPAVLATPARADRPMARPVGVLLDHARDCFAKRHPSVPVEVGVYGPRLGAGADGGALVPLRIVYIGFDPSTSIKVDLQLHINRIVLERLTEARMSTYDPSEQGGALEALKGAFGTSRMVEAAKGMSKMTPGDMLVRAEGRYIRDAQYVEVHLVAMWPDTNCKGVSPVDVVASIDDSAAVPVDVMREAIKGFTASYKAINRIAIVPTIVGTSPLDPAVAGPLEDELERELAKALKPAARPGQTIVGGSEDRQTGPAPIPLARVSRLAFFKEEPKDGDWLARMRVELKGAGPQLSVEFFEVTGQGSAAASRIVSAAALRSVQPFAPAIELLSEQTPLRAGVDPIRYAMKVNRPASLFCAMQDLDGETVLIYPTPDSQRNMHQPRAEALHAPQDLSGTLGGTFGKPVRTLIRCLAVPNGLTRDLERAWMSHTARERLEHKKHWKLTGAEYAKLLGELKGGAEVHETHAILTVVAPAPR